MLPETPQPKTNGFMRLPSIRFEDQAAGGLSDHSSPKYRKPPSEFDEQVWHLGWTDGRYGQPQENNEAVLRAEAKLKWQQKVAAAEAEIESARARVRNLDESVGRLRPAVEELRKGHLNMVTERSQAPQSYSRSLWLLYTVVAFLLFGADLPLSLKLVAMGYGVTTRDNHSSVDHLLTEPLYVVSHFWEAMLLALGIALAGVFVKYFIDSAVLGDESQSNRKDGGGGIPDSGRRKNWYFITFIHLVAALFLATIILLGFFRASVQREQSIKTRTQEKQSLEEQYSKAKDPAVQQSIQLSIKQTERDIEKLEAETPYSLRTVSFILLTLLFPIVGGICFAVGWRKLIKLSQYGRLTKELEAYEKRFGVEVSECESQRGALRALEQKLEREVIEYGSADAYAEMQIGLYRHGYMRGRNVPETIEADASLYERCENSVAKLLAKRMRNKLWEEPSTTAHP